MPQPPPKRGKRTVFTAIAQMERMLRGGNPSDLHRIRNFLFLQYESPLGSVVHATPLFQSLKQAIPDCSIAVAASPMAAAVLQHNPYIDRCVLTPSPLREFARSVSVVRVLVQSMPSGPRAVVTTIGNQRSRLALLSLGAGKATRAGYTLAPELYDVPLHFDPERGQIEGNLDILRRLGHDVPFCEPSLFFSSEDADHASLLLQSLPNGAEVPRIAFVTQNSGGQANQWSQERFAQVVAEMAQTSSAVPIFVGIAGDISAIDSLRENVSNRGISVAGKTTVPQLAAVLAQCDLVISLDTGAFHVARAVGLPGVVIAPAWQSALEWLPVNDARYRVLQGPRIPAPYAGYSIQEIGTRQVLDAALDLLQRFPPSSAQRAARVRNSLPSPPALRQ